MKITDVKNIKIAKKYSSALLTSAIEKNCADKIYQDLIFIGETLETNENLQAILLNPVVKIDDKKEIIKKLFSVHLDKMTLDFMLLLIEENRIDIFKEIINQYIFLYDNENNIAKPSIISAVELDDEQKKRIVDKLEAKLSKKIIPEFMIEPDIIGGLIIEIEDKTIDCSIRAKFENMKQLLTKGNKYGHN